MAEMLYYLDQVPPPDVLQHAVLFSDRLATVGRQVPDVLQPLRPYSPIDIGYQAT